MTASVEVLHGEYGDDAHDKRAMADRLHRMTDYSFRFMPDLIQYGDLRERHQKIGTEVLRISGMAMEHRPDPRTIIGATDDFYN